MSQHFSEMVSHACMLSPCSFLIPSGSPPLPASPSHFLVWHTPPLTDNCCSCSLWLLVFPVPSLAFMSLSWFFPDFWLLIFNLLCSLQFLSPPSRKVFLSPLLYHPLRDLIQTPKSQCSSFIFIKVILLQIQVFQNPNFHFTAQILIMIF